MTKAPDVPSASRKRTGGIYDEGRGCSGSKPEEDRTHYMTKTPDVPAEMPREEGMR